MGIDRATAESALEAHAGDLEATINYIFSAGAGAGTGHTSQTPQSISRPQSRSPSVATPDFPDLKTDPEAPLAVLPSPNAYLENYFLLWLLAVSIHAPQCATAHTSPLIWSREWYRSSTLDLAQLLKILVTLTQTHSNRSLISTQTILNTLDPQVTTKLAEDPHLYSVLPTFIKSVCQDLDSKDFFISSALHSNSQDEARETFLALFHFLPEEYDTNLYRMFNVLLFPDEDEVDNDTSLWENSLQKLSPVLTIVFNQQDDDDSNDEVLLQGVEIPMEFYPQLYTKDCKDRLIKKILLQRKVARQQLKKLMHDIDQLRSFQGKSVNMLLNSTIEFYKDDNQFIVDKLTSLKSQVDLLKQRQLDEYKTINQRLSQEWNLAHPENATVNTAKQLGLIDEPYLLSMAVINPRHYLIRNSSDLWYEVDFAKEVISQRISVQDVQSKLKENTKRPSQDPLMFIYCHRKCLLEREKFQEMINSNESIMNFLRQDEDFLKMKYSVTEDLIDMDSSNDSSI